MWHVLAHRLFLLVLRVPGGNLNMMIPYRNDKHKVDYIETMVNKGPKMVL